MVQLLDRDKSAPSTATDITATSALRLSGTVGVDGILIAEGLDVILKSGSNLIEAVEPTGREGVKLVGPRREISGSTQMPARLSATRQMPHVLRC